MGSDILDLGADHASPAMPDWRWSRGAPTAADAADFDAADQARNFLIAHFVSGLGWAYFASLGCDACQVDQFPSSRRSCCCSPSRRRR